MPLARHIEALSATQPDMRTMPESLPNYEPNVGYFRPCQLGESAKDVLTEAVEHGSILALKVSVFCIMPFPVDGWMQIHGITKHGVAA